MRHSAAASALLILLSVTRPASAQEHTTVADSAERVYQQGVDAHQKGSRLSLERSIEAWVRAASLARQTRKTRDESVLLDFIGRAHHQLEQSDSALGYYLAALAIERKTGDRRGESETLSNIADAYESLGRSTQALASYRRALAIARDLEDRAAEAATLLKIAAVHDAHDDFDSALGYYRRSSDIARQAKLPGAESEALAGIGSIHQVLGQPDSALAYSRAALTLAREVEFQRGEETALHNIGMVFEGLGDADSALTYYRSSLGIARKTGDPRGEGETLNNIGVVRDRLGQYDSALASYRAALVLHHGIGFRRGEGTLHNNIGNALQHLGQPDSAIAYFRSSLVIARELGNRSGQGYSLNNIATVYDGLGQFDSALTYYSSALAIARELRNRHLESILFNNIAGVHDRLGAPDSAHRYYLSSLAIHREIRNPNGEGTTLHNIGRLYNTMGRADSALAFYGRALGLRREAVNRAGEAMTLQNIGDVYYRTLVPSQRAVAVAYYDSAAAALAAMAGRSGGDFNRVSFSEQGVPLFERWTLAWLARSEEVGKRESLLAALAVTERGRAQALLQLIRGLEAPRNPGSDMVNEGKGVMESGTRAGAVALSYLVTSDTLLVWFVLPSGAIELSRHAVSRDSIAGLVAALRMELGADDAAARSRMALQSDVEAEVQRPGTRFTPGRVEGTRAGASTAARTLAALVLPPGLAQAIGTSGELVIVPQGPLALVPFAALPADTAATPLGIRYALRYAPSFSTLNEARNRAAGRRGDATRLEAFRSGLVVGNPEMPTIPTSTGSQVRLPPLPAAESEAKWLGRRLRLAPLIGSQATEAAVRRRLSRVPVVHFATHGVAYSSESRARDSFLALAPGPKADDVKTDGLLTVGELLDDQSLSLSAELVVLSACQTGLGDLKHAEGTVGMQRAFLARGARSVLVSLWSVSDDATELLMKRFYTHWLNPTDSISKAEALRRAQDDVRRSPEFVEPRFWAAFQLVGAP